MGFLRRRGLSTRAIGVVSLIGMALVLDTFVLATVAYAQSGAAGAEAAQQLPVEFQVFLSLVNAGGFVLAVWGFIKGWMVPGYIHDQSLDREAGVRRELTTLRDHVDEKVLNELQRSRETHDEMRRLIDRIIPVIERFIILVERQERGS